MKKLLLLGLILAFLFLPVPVNAQQINKFGIHTLEPSEVLLAKELVNSSGGDWGFVTIVIREDDMNLQKWQKFFDDCRINHLVPIVRISTYMEKDFWAKPSLEIIDKWVEFFSLLNWPVKDRFVVVYNEPNHKKEWGGELNPEEYAQILDKAIDAFHRKSTDFKILNAGFDQAASNTRSTMNALNFWKKMNDRAPGIFGKIDGWASHSYPNHGFVGTPNDFGRTSVRGYQWELAILKKNFGLTKDLPVFITETGWPYKLLKNERFFNEQKTAEYIKYAFQNIWITDDRVVAVTPFILFYPQPPFANFSWVKADNSKSVQFLSLQAISKDSWWPEQMFGLNVVKIHLPPFMPTHSDFYGNVTIRNTGQSIWGEKDKIRFSPKNNNLFSLSELFLPPGVKVKPGEEVSLDFTLSSASVSGIQQFSWEKFPVFEINILPATTITKTKYSIWQIFSSFFQKYFFQK